MTRSLDTALLGAVKSPHVLPFMAAELMYPDGPVRVSSLPVAKVIDGQTYHGAGVMGEISELEEGSENRSYGFSLTVSGIPGDWADYLKSQDVQGRLVTIRLGFCDANYSIIGSKIITVGRMDAQDVEVGERTAIVVSCESIAVDWERARIRRCTDADQRSQHAGDTFFKYVAALQNMSLEWGYA